MKRILVTLIICFCLIWVLVTKDGNIYTGKEIETGRWGVTITIDNNETKVTIPWNNISSLTQKENKKK